jgi:hypothetical protein
MIMEYLNQKKLQNVWNLIDSLIIKTKLIFLFL